MLVNLNLALQITLVGMGLVFAAIVLLWGLMALLVRLAPEHPETKDEPGTDNDKDATLRPDQTRLRQRAAAIAVAIALAQQADTTKPHEFPLPPTAIVSAWQAVLRTRMLNKRGPTRRGPN